MTTPKYAFTYDGSRDFTIGLAPDPQAQPICNVWDNNIDKGQAKAELVCDALNNTQAMRDVLEEIAKECASDFCCKFRPNATGGHYLPHCPCCIAKTVLKRGE